MTWSTPKPELAGPRPASATPDFDRIAGVYRWCEYLCLGPLLQRTRIYYLPRLTACRQALVLGDGDGRFTARLLATNQTIRVHAVDTSAAMLERLQANASRITPAASARLSTERRNALKIRPPDSIDLIVTHFFLDCLEQWEVEALVAGVTPGLCREALWLFSDFRIPNGLLHWPARIYVRALYAAFGLLTGLRITRLPDHGAALRTAGFRPLAKHLKLLGLLSTELWQRAP